MGGTVTQDQTTQLQFTVGSETWTVAKHVLVVNTSTSAVVTNTSQSKLFNNGNIYSLVSFGVDLSIASTGAVVTNNKGALIKGSLAGVNAGSQADGNLIVNAGVITSPVHGVLVHASQNTTTKIENAAAGTISGGEAAIFVSQPTSGGYTGGAINLMNKGSIVGDIVTLAPDRADKVVNKGTISGDVLLGSGNDSFVFAGGKQGTVFGEAGADRFDFKAKLVTGKDAAKIGDMTPGTDTIGLSKKLFGDIGPKGEALKKKYFEVGKKADDANDRIIYDKASGKLYYDKDGKGGSDQKLFAKLDKDLDLKAGDILVIA